MPARTTPSRPGRRIGIMGGTFNPVHNGHLRAAEEVAESLGLDQVYFVPAANPPHKPAEPLADYRRRLEMLQLAVAERPGFWASDLESRLPFPSYTVNTLRAFKKIWGTEATVFFLVGLDAFLTVTTWHEYQELFRLASFAVFERPGTTMAVDEFLTFLRGRVNPALIWDERRQAFTAPDFLPIHRQPGCRLEISSSDLRLRLESGASVRYLAPEAVRTYIEHHHLYGRRGPARPDADPGGPEAPPPRRRAGC